MSTIAEIESAIESLPSPEVAQLAVWLEEFRRCRVVPAGGEHHELDGLIGTWREDAAFHSVSCLAKSRELAQSPISLEIHERYIANSRSHCGGSWLRR